MFGKVIKIFLWVGVILFLVFVLLVVQILFRPTLLIHPINRAIYLETEFGRPVHLIPGVFEIGNNLKSVESRLWWAGYSYVEPEFAWKRYEKEILDDHRMYIKDASRIPCNLKFYALLKFDQNQHLVSGFGVMNEHGCF